MDCNQFSPTCSSTCPVNNSYLPAFSSCPQSLQSCTPYSPACLMCPVPCRITICTPSISCSPCPPKCNPYCPPPCTLTCSPRCLTRVATCPTKWTIIS